MVTIGWLAATAKATAAGGETGRVNRVFLAEIAEDPFSERKRDPD